MHLCFHSSAQLWGCPSAASCAAGPPPLCPLPNEAAAWWAGVPAGMGSAWERKDSKIPSSSRDTSQDAGTGVALRIAVAAQGLIARCQPQPCPMGIAASQMMVGKALEVGKRLQAGLLPPCLSLQRLARERGKNMRFDGKRHGKTTKLTETQTKQNQREGGGEGAQQQEPHVNREAGRARVCSLA